MRRTCRIVVVQAVWMLGVGCGETGSPQQIVLPGPPFELAWRADVYGYTRAVVDDSSLYIHGAHVVYALDKKSGAVRWTTRLTYSYPTDIFEGFGMAMAGGRLIVGDIDVFGLDPATGSIAWRFATALPRERVGTGHLSSDGSTVYAGSVYGNTYAIDGKTGASRWTTFVAPDSNFNVHDPVLVDGVVYVGLLGTAGAHGGGAAAIDARDGRLLWTTIVPGDPVVPGGSLGVGVSASLVVVGNSTGPVYGLDRQTGQIKITLPTGTFAAPNEPPGEKQFHVVSHGSTVYLGTNLGVVAALDGTDLHTLWKTLTGSTVFDIRADGDRVYVAAPSASGLTVLNTSTGSIVWHVTGTQVGSFSQPEDFASAPAVDSSTVYIGGQYGVYAFKRQ